MSLGEMIKVADRLYKLGIDVDDVEIALIEMMKSGQSTEKIREYLRNLIEKVVKYEG